MSVLIIVEAINGKLNKGAFEICTYGYQTAKVSGSTCHALIIGDAENKSDVGKYGINTAHEVANVDFDSKVYTQLIANATTKLGATTIVMRHNSTTKNVAGRLAIKMNAGLVSGVKSIPVLTSNGLSVDKSVYSGKAIATYEISSPNKIITVMGNTLQPEIVGDAIDVTTIDLSLPSPKTRVVERKTISGIVPLPEAEMVVSAGRGMKGPENWGIIEELAQELGATTACSRPVADAHWRPHHEHVGQTGVAIRPNLYFAIGISGAIQHLAGVNSSKTIVVINKDPEAPFFKAADYGVVGDLFDVVPSLTEAIKKFKQH
jgi:electron transfer flavoprotein alpha subunit